MQNALTLRDTVHLAWKNSQPLKGWKFVITLSSLLLGQAGVCYKSAHYAQGRILTSLYSVRKMSVIYLRRSLSLKKVFWFSNILQHAPSDSVYSTLPCENSSSEMQWEGEWEDIGDIGLQHDATEKLSRFPFIKPEAIFIKVSVHREGRHTHYRLDPHILGVLPSSHGVYPKCLVHFFWIQW